MLNRDFKDIFQLLLEEGVDSRTCGEHRVVVAIDDLRIPAIGRREPIVNKQASGRAQDLLDVDVLEKGRE